LYGAIGIAIDGSGNAWIANYGSVTELSSSGVALSPSTGLSSYSVAQGNYSAMIAVDGSGNVWQSYSSGTTALEPSIFGLVELIGAGTPVVTPIAAGLPATPTANGSSNLGTRP
jgi:hypothetical protein